MNDKKVKIVYEDAGINKVAFGYAEDLGGFIRVSVDNKNLTINKRFIVSIKDGF